MPSSSIAAALVLLLAAAGPALGQVTFVQGTVSIDGPSIRTAGGRAELLTTEGALVHVDVGTRLQVEMAGLLVATGRVLVRTSASGLRLQLPGAELLAEPYGAFNVVVGAERGLLLVKVLAGQAHLVTRYGASTTIGRGQLAMMTGPTGVPWTAAYWPEGPDDFEAWSGRRASRVAVRRAWAAPPAPLPGPVPVGACPDSAPCGWSEKRAVNAGSWGGVTARTHGGWNPGPPRRTRGSTFAPDYAPDYSPHYAPGAPRRTSAEPVGSHGAPEYRPGQQPSSSTSPPAARAPQTPARSPVRGLAGSLHVPGRPDNR